MNYERFGIVGQWFREGARRKNCGAGADGDPGFQQDNTCAEGGRGPSVASIPVGEKFSISPSDLEFTEGEQHRMDEARERFPEGDALPPIVVVISDDGPPKIIDGHHRATLAQERDESIEAVGIKQAEFDKLKEAGFDEIEISWAVMDDSGEHEQADALDSQFAGAGVAARGRKAERALSAMRKALATRYDWW